MRDRVIEFSGFLRDRSRRMANIAQTFSDQGRQMKDAVVLCDAELVRTGHQTALKCLQSARAYCNALIDFPTQYPDTSILAGLRWYIDHADLKSFLRGFHTRVGDKADLRAACNTGYVLFCAAWMSHLDLIERITEILSKVGIHDLDVAGLRLRTAADRHLVTTSNSATG